jgi:hypothetical protein
MLEHHRPQRRRQKHLAARPGRTARAGRRPCRLAGRALAEWPLAELARQRAFLAQSRSDAFAYSVIETVLSARHPYHDNRYWEDSDDHAIAMQSLEAMEVADLARATCAPCPAASASAWRLPPCWRRTRRCCCSTNRPMRWISRIRSA